jgi:hypothetical protein
MYLSELRDYSDWVGQTAQTIHENVIRLGGWGAVFPSRMPRWASRVRNYFNVTPYKLTRLGPEAEKKIAKAVQRLKTELECEEERQRQEDRKWDRTPDDRRRFPYNKPNPTPIRLPGHCPKEPSETIRNISWTQALALKNTLHGAVYQDETKRLWYQMSAGATIYHYGSTPGKYTQALEAALVEKVKGQNDTPVFKMISPDGTGGSHEVIIKNRGSDTLVPAGASIILERLIEQHAIYRGSYNYADAMVVGFAAHDIRDVKPHVASATFYVNPNPHLTLGQRVFPAKDPRNPNDKPLAEQN